MNYVVLMGRLTRDPEIRYSQSTNLAIARYTLAVDRQRSNNGQSDEPTADFINCVAFDKAADFASKFLHKGTKIAIEGRIVTGSYNNKEGQKVYTTEVRVNRHEFCESKGASQNAGDQGNNSQGYGNPTGSYGYNNPNNKASAPQDPVDDGFMNVPDGVDEELPFS